MNGQPTGRRSARSRAAAIAACSVVAAVIGAALIATPANASTLGDVAGCITDTSTVVSDLGSVGGLTGAVESTTADVTGAASCTTGAVLGTGSDSGSTSSPHQPVSRVKKPSSGDTTDPTTDTTTTTSSSAGSSTTLDTLTLDRSSNAVYPVKDGYLDTVRIAVRAADADGDAVAVQGSAVLSKAGRSLKTWTLDGTSRVITWNGRIGRAIRTGLYTVKVTAWSADGSKLSSSTRVRVLSAHLEKRALVVRSDVGAESVSADMPRQLLKAYAMGEVTVRVRTVARVTGPARLVFSSSTGVTRYVALKNGTRVTPALPVPAGFSHVTITHDWAKGAAHLKSLQAIWNYYTLS